VHDKAWQGLAMWSVHLANNARALVTGWQTEPRLSHSTTCKRVP
jgi:hypothetical protein